jgi:tellurite resistance protein
MTEHLSEEVTFNLEVLKLLLTVAWVDGEVDQQEANMLLGLGRSWTVPERALQQLMQTIKAGERPTEPDYALLRTRKDDALQAARALMLADGKAKSEEIALLKRVQAALAG